MSSKDSKKERGKTLKAFNEAKAQARMRGMRARLLAVKCPYLLIGDDLRSPQEFSQDKLRTFSWYEFHCMHPANPELVLEWRDEDMPPECDLVHEGECFLGEVPQRDSTE